MVMLDTAPNLSISPEKLCFIIAKAREFDVKDVVTDPDDASNPTDDAMLAVLEDHPDDPVLEELTGFIGALSEESKSTWSRSRGLVAGMERSMTGMISAPKLRGLTIGAPPRTFSECRCFRTIWRTPSPSLASHATIDVLPVWPQTRSSAHDAAPRVVDGDRFRLFALSATAELGKAIAETVGQPMAVHEERDF